MYPQFNESENLNDWLKLSKMSDFGICYVHIAEIQDSDAIIVKIEMGDCLHWKNASDAIIFDLMILQI